jgi:threonine/homoserine efflux transporter RhtA
MIQEIWSTVAIDEFLVYLRDIRNLKITPKTGVLSANLPYDLYSVALPRNNFQNFSEKWGDLPFALDSFNHF